MACQLSLPFGEVEWCWSLGDVTWLVSVCSRLSSWSGVIRPRTGIAPICRWRCLKNVRDTFTRDNGIMAKCLLRQCALWFVSVWTYLINSALLQIFYGVAVHLYMFVEKDNVSLQGRIVDISQQYVLLSMIVGNFTKCATHVPHWVTSFMFWYLLIRCVIPVQAVQKYAMLMSAKIELKVLMGLGRLKWFRLF